MAGRVSFLLTVILVLATATNLGRADEISFVADEWAPFNGTPGKEPEGYLLDIARAVFEPKGHRVKYSVLPWTRALRGVEDGTYDALLGPFPSEAPSLIFPDEEVGFTTLSFFTRADSTWKFAGPESLKGIRLGIIQDYAYRPWLQEFRRIHPENFIVLSGEDAVERNLQLLIRGRIDAIPTNEQSFRYRAKRAGVLEKIRLAGRDAIGEGKKLYIAFSPKRQSSERYAKLLSDGIRELRRSGRLEEILARYGLEDWK